MHSPYPVRATAPMVEVEKVAPDAELKSRRNLEIASNLRVNPLRQELADCAKGIFHQN